MAEPTKTPWALMPGAHVDPTDPRYVIAGGRRLLRHGGGEETPEEKAAREQREAEQQREADERERREREERERGNPEPQLGPDGQPWDPERAGRTIAAQREAERQAKEERDDALAKLKEYEDADLSEKERLEREAKEAREKAEAAEAREATAQETIRRGNLLAELAKPEHRIVDANAAAKLLEDVEYDDDGKPTNLTTKDAGNPESKSLLDRFLESHGYLQGQPQKPPPPRIDAGPEGEPTEVNLTAEELKAAEKAGMTPEQYEARKGVKTLADHRRVQAQERAAQTQ